MIHARRVSAGFWGAGLGALVGVAGREGALVGVSPFAGAGCSTLAEAVVGVTCSVSCVGTVKILTFISSSVWEGSAQVRSR